jgi:hypothetical protein
MYLLPKRKGSFHQIGQFNHDPTRMRIFNHCHRNSHIERLVEVVRAAAKILIIALTNLTVGTPIAIKVSVVDATGNRAAS